MRAPGARVPDSWGGPAPRPTYHQPTCSKQYNSAKKKPPLTQPLSRFYFADRRASLTCSNKGAFPSPLPQHLHHREDILISASAHVEKQDLSTARASAWAGSSAGMIPSNREHSWKASSASSSVAETYFTRPLSCSQACSGPMPG